MLVISYIILLVVFIAWAFHAQDDMERSTEGMAARAIGGGLFVLDESSKRLGYPNPTGNVDLPPPTRGEEVEMNGMWSIHGVNDWEKRPSGWSCHAWQGLSPIS